jgi:hypothetical protein
MLSGREVYGAEWRDVAGAIAGGIWSGVACHTLVRQLDISAKLVRRSRAERSRNNIYKLAQKDIHPG